MRLTASKLRADIYRILDQVLETGVPIEIERHGKILKIVRLKPPRNWTNLLHGRLFCEESFQHVITLALQQTWTRDPFDRIIVGQAALQQRTLVTKDHAMRGHYPYAVWDE